MQNQKESQAVIEKASQARMEAFKKEYVELTKKYDCDLVSFPQYIPSGEHGFTTTTTIQIFDKKKIPTESPYQEPIIKK